MRRIGSKFLVVALAAVWGLASAQAKPNFSGSWKLNASKSDFGAIPAPDSRTDKITHEEPNLADTMSTSGQMGDVTADLKYSTDGKETTNSIRGNEIKSTAKWEGDELVISSKGSIQGNDLTLTDHWSLSEDGKTLTISRHINSPMGETDQKVILEKQ